MSRESEEIAKPCLEKRRRMLERLALEAVACLRRPDCGSRMDIRCPWCGRRAGSRPTPTRKNEEILVFLLTYRVLQNGD